MKETKEVVIFIVPYVVYSERDFAKNSLPLKTITEPCPKSHVQKILYCSLHDHFPASRRHLELNTLVLQLYL